VPALTANNLVQTEMAKFQVILVLLQLTQNQLYFVLILATSFCSTIYYASSCGEVIPAFLFAIAAILPS
jgi:uncharacterized membrane protein (DUF485 family)